MSDFPATAARRGKAERRHRVGIGKAEGGAASGGEGSGGWGAAVEGEALSAPWPPPQPPSPRPSPLAAYGRTVERLAPAQHAKRRARRLAELVEDEKFDARVPPLVVVSPLHTTARGGLRVRAVPKIQNPEHRFSKFYIFEM